LKPENLKSNGLFNRQGGRFLGAFEVPRGRVFVIVLGEIGRDFVALWANDMRLAFSKHLNLSFYRPDGDYMTTNLNFVLASSI
jgi:hypothetical protein